MSRFFVDGCYISGGAVRIIGREDLHHITKVLRLAPGAKIEISDSVEWEYEAEILSIAQDEVCARILDKQKFAREPAIKVSLFQGVPKQGKMEAIIQKTVELGVYEILPVFTARSVVRESGDGRKKAERWQRIADEAVKQCRRGIRPVVHPLLSFDAAVSLFSKTPQAFDLILFPYENEEEHSIKTILRGLDRVPERIAMIIGPEGGFSEEEAEALISAGAVSVSLGKTILRTETAGPSALAMILYELEL